MIGIMTIQRNAAQKISMTRIKNYCDDCDHEFPVDELYPVGKYVRLCDNCMEEYQRSIEDDFIREECWDNEH